TDIAPMVRRVVDMVALNSGTEGKDTWLCLSMHEEDGAGNMTTFILCSIPIGRYHVIFGTWVSLVFGR
ncbi:hypothetical protein A2U01_0011635, partial [Trifolium medium]|nr:hypothetical protein [Trifolium medium]